MEAAEAAEEGGVGGVPEPAPGDEGGADEGGGEGEAQQDFAEEVVVAEHRWDRGRRRHCSGLRALPLGFHRGQALELIRAGIRRAAATNSRVQGRGSQSLFRNRLC